MLQTQISYLMPTTITITTHTDLLPPYRYFMIGPTAQQTRCMAWLVKNLPSHGRVSVRDVTSMYTSINVIGPKGIEVSMSIDYSVDHLII